MNGHLVDEGKRIFDINTAGFDYLKVTALRFEESIKDRLGVTYHPHSSNGLVVDIGSFKRLPDNARWALVTSPV